jgi:hypothetical protein
MTGTGETELTNTIWFTLAQRLHRAGASDALHVLLRGVTIVTA